MGKKVVTIPAVKVADGVIATSQLVYLTLASANTATAADGFQREISRQQNAQIKYLISQAKVRTSELKTTSVKDFIKVLRDIKADQKGLALDNVEVSAYASPDGTLKFNTGLAENRKGSAQQYVNGQLKKTKLNTNVDAKYTAEDWDGFQELVAASNIQDKEVILRVLSMYKDPEEREQQIKNLSVAFRELANEVLPELRRARLTVNYRVIGRSDEEIRAQYAADASKLTVEELLYAATLTNDAAERKAIFNKATELYPQDKRAYNGLAQLAYAAGNLSDAENALTHAEVCPKLMPTVHSLRSNKATSMAQKLSSAKHSPLATTTRCLATFKLHAATTLKPHKTSRASTPTVLHLRKSSTRTMWLLHKLSLL